MLNELVNKILFILAVNSIIVMELTAQKHDNNWTFGVNAGINFNDSLNPVAFRSICYNYEASSCVSDANGSLLFYLNNPQQLISEIIDSNGNIIANGDLIEAHISSTSGAIIIPDSFGNRYMIFHLGYEQNGSSGSYSKLFLTVVSSANDTLIVEKKNHKLLDEFLHEKTAAVRHADGIGWWLIAHTQNVFSGIEKSRFYKFLVRDTSIEGISFQDFGISSNVKTDFYGQMQFSKEGNKLGLVRSGNKYFEVFDFNRCNGALTLRHNGTINSSGALYGIEFSENERFLYLTGGIANSSSLLRSELFQVDLDTIGQPLLIDTSGRTFGQLQLAPDGKIYLANQRGAGFPESGFNPYNQNLSVIHQPDSAGLACNFQPFSFYLGDSSKSSVGLPNFPNYRLGALSIYEADAGRDTILCSDTLQKVALLGKPAIAGVQYQWFPDYNLSSDTTAEVLAYPDTTTMYYVWITDSSITNSCKSRLDSVYVDVKVCNVGIAVPPSGVRGLVRLYPNPAYETITIEITTKKHQLQSITLHDVTGKAKTLPLPIAIGTKGELEGDNKITLNIKELSQGIYFCNITLTNGQTLTRKIIKQQ